MRCQGREGRWGLGAYGSGRERWGGVRRRMAACKCGRGWVCMCGGDALRTGTGPHSDGSSISSTTRAGWGPLGSPLLLSYPVGKPPLGLPEGGSCVLPAVR